MIVLGARGGQEKVRIRQTFCCAFQDQVERISKVYLPWHRGDQPSCRGQSEEAKSGPGRAAEREMMELADEKSWKAQEPALKAADRNEAPTDF